MTETTATAHTVSTPSRPEWRTRAPQAMLGIFRIVAAGLFSMHGAHTLLGWFGGSAASTPAFLSWPGWWSGAIELIAGLLVMLGLWARPAAVLCSGTMAFAYFTVHQPKALLPLENSGEPAALYSWIFLLIAIVGPGAFALSKALRRQPVA